MEAHLAPLPTVERIEREMLVTVHPATVSVGTHTVSWTFTDVSGEWVCTRFVGRTGIRKDGRTVPAELAEWLTATKTA